MNLINSVERKNCTAAGMLGPNGAIEMRSTFAGFSYSYADPDKL